jgi:hypothetical protein
MSNVMDKLRALWRNVMGYVSPTFVMLLCASFILWYILKLQYTYTTDYSVVVNINGDRLRVPCVVEGKGTNLFGYRVYMHREINIPLSDLKYVQTQMLDEQTGEVRDDVLLFDAQSLHSAISVRVSDIKVISVGDVPPLFPSRDE